MAVSAKQEKTVPFGSRIPFAEPYWYSGTPSPYYKETHIQFRAKLREFVDKEMLSYVHEWDEAGYSSNLAKFEDLRYFKFQVTLPCYLML
jgi:hypothetical protein